MNENRASARFGPYRGAAMTVAGSDSGGGAGIQADLKTFAAMKIFGTTAITAVTVQNTTGVSGFTTLPPEAVRAQIRAVASDMGVRTFKTGMLGNAAVCRAVAETLEEIRQGDRGNFRLVVDPVMVAQSGDTLMEPDAVRAIRERLLPLATLITPNIPEAEQLLGLPSGAIRGVDDMTEAARALAGKVPAGVLLKGGHMPESEMIADVLVTGEGTERLESGRIDTDCNHGTGCTLSAAIASELAAGRDLRAAVEVGLRYLRAAMRAGVRLGAGAGCLGHALEGWQ